MRFMLRVEVADVSSRYAVLSVLGPRAGDLAAELDGMAARVEPGSFGTIDLIVARDLLAGAAGELVRRGAVPAGMWAFEALRIAAQVPRFGLDTDHRTIPHEVGWIGTAVHLNKGCYRGQETVARVHNLGHPPRRLVFLDLDGSVDRLPAHGDPVELDGPDKGSTVWSASPGRRRGTTSRARSGWPWSSARCRWRRRCWPGASRRPGGHRAAGRRCQREGHAAFPADSLRHPTEREVDFVLRRVLLAASASPRLRQLITTAPQTRAIVEGYVAGETADDAVRVTRALRAAGLLVSLDYLGEDTRDEAQAAAVTQEYVQLLGKLGAEGLTHRGAAEVSVKPTAVGLSLSPDLAAGNIARICAAAAQAGTTVTLDAEEHPAIEPTMGIAAKLRADHPDLGCVVQACLRRAEDDCRALAGYGIRVRLCKGAYSEPDHVAFTARRDIDQSYARCLKVLMNGPGYPMLATHDPRLIEIAASLARLTGRHSDSFEYQMLYGIRPAEQRRLANTGARMRVYVPYGGDWYAYLVRRLAERPGNLAFFLRSLRSKK